MDAFGNYDEGTGNDEFVLQQPSPGMSMQNQDGDNVQFPVSDMQPAMGGFGQPSEDDDLTEEEKQLVAEV